MSRHIGGLEVKENYAHHRRWHICCISVPVYRPCRESGQQMSVERDSRGPAAGTVVSSSRAEPQDRFARIATLLTYAIFFVIVTALSAVVYFLVAGVFSPPGPRTAIEAKLGVLESAVKDNPASGRVWADYIMYNTRAERYSAAEQAWKDSRVVLAELPEQMIEADLAWAQALLLQGRFDEAIGQADLVITNDPEALAILESRNSLAASTGIVETGALGPAFAVKGNAATALERWDLAVDAYTSVLEITPRDANILVARGVAYRESGDENRARADLEEALRFMPDNEAASRFLKEMGDGR